MTISFYLNEHSTSAEARIYVYVRGIATGKTIVVHSGQTIPSKYWDKKRQVAKRSYTGSPELNSYLNTIREDVKRCYRLLISEGQAQSFEHIRNEIKQAVAQTKGEIIADSEKGIMNESQNTRKLSEVFQLFVDTRATELSKATITKYNSLKKRLTQFDPEDTLFIDQFDHATFDRFKSFLLHEQNHLNGTVHKYVEFLRTFLKWALKRNFHNNTDYTEFSTSDPETDIICLTKDELFDLFRFDFSQVEINVTQEDIARQAKFGKRKVRHADSLEKLTQEVMTKKAQKLKTYEGVRDVFCFCAFTGVRFSDVQNLKRSDIRDGCWHLRTVKTRDPLIIPLNRFALQILEKYQRDESPLPLISAPKTNKYIKEIGKLVGIDEVLTVVHYRGSERIETTGPKYQFLTTHCARRSFVTISLLSGMRSEVCMSLTGHKNYRTFKKYIKITEQVKQQEMDQVWSS